MQNLLRILGFLAPKFLLGDAVKPILVRLLSFVCSMHWAEKACTPLFRAY